MVSKWLHLTIMDILRSKYIKTVNSYVAIHDVCKMKTKNVDLVAVMFFRKVTLKIHNTCLSETDSEIYSRFLQSYLQYTNFYNPIYDI